MQSSHSSSQQSTNIQNVIRKRPPVSSLRIDTPIHNPSMLIAVGDSSASTSSATSDSDFSPFQLSRPTRSFKNMKKLSLSLPSPQPSDSSIKFPPSDTPCPTSNASKPPQTDRSRRLSVVSLPGTTVKTLIHRKEEEGSPSVPYLDGPTQIVPGIWLGSEDNARDWKGLVERGIRSILNVAKEVVSPFDSAKPLRPFASTPNLNDTLTNFTPTSYPAHLPSGRPSMHYLKLAWSHGQQNLVQEGFPAAMEFTDAALDRGDGVLIHCQCGISRSATMVIALVMRAAAHSSPSVPPEVWALKGMQGAYAYVKEKSKWIGPNMSLIYQLLEYERSLQSGNTTSEKSSVLDEEEEWGRQRRILDEIPSDHEDDERESVEVLREARALDKAMEDRIVARKHSGSSIASSGVGMGVAWRNRYGTSRKRTSSIASNMTSGSILSEDLVEEDEEQELLGIGGGFDDGNMQHRSPSIDNSTPGSQDSLSASHLPQVVPLAPRSRAECRPPPSAPVWKTSFGAVPPPATAVKLNFELSPPPLFKPPGRRRPLSIGVLPFIPSSPIALTVDDTPAVPPGLDTPPQKKSVPAPLHFRKPAQTSFAANNRQTSVSTPSQTLFVFPPSPTLTTRTPSTMTLTSHLNYPVPFPSISTPRVSSFRSQGRTRSFIGLGVPPTPTTACSRVDARGWVGLDVRSVN